MTSQVQPWLNLNNKIVLVTGASSGLGRQFCIDLAKAGCKIIAAARRIDRLESLCRQINQFKIKPLDNDDRACNTLRAVAVELDVTADGSTIESSVQKAWDAFGHIDVLINNAGIRGNVRSPIDLSEEEWNTVFKTNLTGAWLVAKHVGLRIRDARRQEGGSIINISSIAGLNRVQLRGGLAYGSSKAGIDSMTKIMALEFGEFNIRVNSIAPGFFQSEITGDLLQKEGFKNFIIKTLPLKAAGTSDPALTSLVRYLIDDSSSYISGNVFIVDAGFTLPGIPLFSSL